MNNWIGSIDRALVLCLVLTAFGCSSKGTSENQRVVILADVGVLDEKDQKDRDDIQSLVRLLMYSNNLDIEGLVATKSRKNDFAINDHSRNVLDVFPETILHVIDGYESVYPNLLLHDKNYPKPEYLRSIVKSGNPNKDIPWSGSDETRGIGPGKNTEASDLIVEVLKKDDPRPVWFCVWGKAIDLAQALSDLRDNLSPAELEKVVAKVRVYDIVGQDNTGAWIAHHFPGVFYIRSLRQFRAFGDTKIIGDNSLITDEWADEHVRSHGALGERYVVNHLTLKDKAFHFEGDTPSFVYLIGNGLSDPMYPHFGNWGGRFSEEPQRNVNSLWSAKAEEPFHDFWMYTDAGDTWLYDDSLYVENVYAPVARWRQHYQNDFQARMDWCVMPFDKANHNPIAVIEGKRGNNIVVLEQKSGDKISLDASGSEDPDGNELSYTWTVYPEPGTYKGEVEISNQTSPKATLLVPDVTERSTIHVILTVRDNGTPELYSYRRIIVNVEPRKGS